MKILKKIVEKMIHHAKGHAPIEGCGYLAGKDQVITFFLPMTNIDASPIHYSFDPQEQFEALRQARANDLDLTGVYHSHPDSPAFPSKEDTRLAYDPDLSYIIVSLKNGKPEVNSFKISKGRVQRETLQILNEECR